jgi:hypothetical protein
VEVHHGDERWRGVRSSWRSTRFDFLMLVNQTPPCRPSLMQG